MFVSCLKMYLIPIFIFMSYYYASAFIASRTYTVSKIMNSMASTDDRPKFREIVVDVDNLENFFGNTFDENDISDNENTSEVNEDDVAINSSLDNEIVLEELSVSSPTVLVMDKEMDSNDLIEYASSFDLNKKLDQSSRLSIFDYMSLEGSEEVESSKEVVIRQVSYNPGETERFRNDPMNYGAYRRWKETVERNKAKKSKKTEKPKDKNSFFNAIKNLGSGPVPKDTMPGVGVAEPPKGMFNVQPKKAPSRGGKSKKVITPDDINRLFSGTPKEAEDDDTPYDFFSKPNEKGEREKIPDWILDAEKDAKKSKALKANKTKPLTKDWRFWAAIIAATGVASAAYNVYQITGGMGSGAQELVI